MYASVDDLPAGPARSSPDFVNCVSYAFPRESKAAGSSQATYPYFEVVSGDEPSFKMMLLCWMHPFRILASFHLLFFSAISSLSIGLPVKPRPTSDGDSRD